MGKERKSRIAVDAAEYVSLLNAHYHEFKAYRLSQVQDVHGKISSGVQHSGNLRSPNFKAEMVHTWTMTSDKDKNPGVDEFSGESYLDTCTVTGGRRKYCYPCDTSRYNLKQHGSAYEACRNYKAYKCDNTYISSSCTSGKCCDGKKPCLLVQYETCTKEYRDKLISDMEDNLKARIDKFTEAMRHVLDPQIQYTLVGRGCCRPHDDQEGQGRQYSHSKDQCEARCNARSDCRGFDYKTNDDCWIMLQEPKHVDYKYGCSACYKREGASR